MSLERITRSIVLLLLIAPGICLGQVLMFRALDYVEPVDIADQIQQMFGLQRTPRIVLQDVHDFEQMVALVYGADPQLFDYFKTNPTEMPVAHTGPNGTIYIHTSNPYYYAFPRPDVQPIPDKVRAAIVHQAIHAASVYHFGLPSVGESTSPASSLNEAVTEYFASRVFTALYNGDYEKLTTFMFDKTIPESDGTRFVRVWAGNHVPLIMRELSITEDDLIRMYFEMPFEFERRIGKERVTPQGRELREVWLEFLPNLAR